MSTAKNSTLKHRSFIDVYGIREDCDPFQRVADFICSWLVEKESCYKNSPIIDDFARSSPLPRAWDYAKPESYHGGDYNDDIWTALASATERDDEGNIKQWIVEYDEPDSKQSTQRWHTTVCLEPQENGSCRVGTEVSCRPVNPNAEPILSSVAAPSLVRSIINLPWYVSKVGTTQLQTVPHKLSVQTFDDFTQSLVDPGRGIPLILFCTGLRGTMPEQAKEVARRAMGTANVYVLDWSNEELRNKLHAYFKRGTSAGEYACPKNSCRMYMPGVDLSDAHHSGNHECWDYQELNAVPPSTFGRRLAMRLIPNRPIPMIENMQDELTNENEITEEKISVNEKTNDDGQITVEEQITVDEK